MKTKNLMVGILGGVLVVALWYTMLLKPIKAKTSKVKADTTNQESRLSPLQSQLARAQNDAKHVATFNAQLKSLQEAMPDSPALAAFIRDVNNISEASGVAWQSVTHSPPTPGANGSMSLTVGIQVKGTYGQVVDYLTRLSALQRLVVVDSVQLSTAGSSGAGGAQTSGGSTGPFTGSSELSATIAARMFEAPAALPLVGAGVGSATPAASGGSTQSGPPGVNNS
jgi:Tfp pilus assembly protein PilO